MDNIVQIAYVHQNHVTHSFHHSMMRLTNKDFDSYKLQPYNLAARGTTLALVEARNELMRHFLDETQATHIWWIDTDMGFHADTIDKLLAAGQEVVGALCYGQAELEPDDLGGYETDRFVVAYDLVQQQDGLMHYSLKQLDIDENIHQVAATGTGCLLVSRNAAHRVRKAFGDAWFDQVSYPNTRPVMRISEDLSFCYRLSTVSIPIYVHTGVKTSHMKSVWLS